MTGKIRALQVINRKQACRKEGNSAEKKKKFLLTKQGTANIIVYALARETSSQP
jgi:hypothetical protein